MNGLFATWQPQYAERGLPTFPVRITNDEKKPAVRNYMKIGKRASTRLVESHGEATAFGVACGPTTGLTVLDVDSPDEHILADALDRHGRTPFITRTGSGNFQAWYRHDGESRRIRAWGDDVPIDQLGNGYVVAPPSQGAQRSYEIISGCLDDLPNLPRMCEPWKPTSGLQPKSVKVGQRNHSLFLHCMTHAPSCDTFEDLLDVAQTFNDFACECALDRAEVSDTAKSAWRITERGDNRIGQYGAWFTLETVKSLVSDPYLTALVAWLQAHNAPDRTFWVADGLATVLNWPRRKFQQARKQAVAQGWIVPLTKPKPDHPVEYRWGPTRLQKAA